MKDKFLEQTKREYLSFLVCGKENEPGNLKSPGDTPNGAHVNPRR
jgi:hypothetical protein